MFYRNNNGPAVYSTGCSTIGCLFGFLIFSLVIGRGIVFFFRYFWLIVLLGIVVWAFRRLTSSNSTNTTTRQKKPEQPSSTYDNISREFEEIDEEEDQHFNDF